VPHERALDGWKGSESIARRAWSSGRGSGDDGGGPLNGLHADRAALAGLVKRAPWPEHRMWIRRGHGFFVVGREIEETTQYAFSQL